MIRQVGTGGVDGETRGRAVGDAGAGGTCCDVRNLADGDQGGRAVGGPAAADGHPVTGVYGRVHGACRAGGVRDRSRGVARLAHIPLVGEAGGYGGHRQRDGAPGVDHRWILRRLSDRRHADVESERRGVDVAGTDPHPHPIGGGGCVGEYLIVVGGIDRSGQECRVRNVPAHPAVPVELRSVRRGHDLHHEWLAGAERVWCRRPVHEGAAPAAEHDPELRVGSDRRRRDRRRIAAERVGQVARVSDEPLVDREVRTGRGESGRDTGHDGVGRRRRLLDEPRADADMESRTVKSGNVVAAVAGSANPVGRGDTWVYPDLVDRALERHREVQRLAQIPLVGHRRARHRILEERGAASGIDIVFKAPRAGRVEWVANVDVNGRAVSDTTAVPQADPEGGRRTDEGRVIRGQGGCGNEVRLVADLACIPLIADLRGDAIYREIHSRAWRGPLVVRPVNDADRAAGADAHGGDSRRGRGRAAVIGDDRITGGYRGRDPDGAPSSEGSRLAQLVPRVRRHGYRGWRVDGQNGRGAIVNQRRLRLGCKDDWRTTELAEPERGAISRSPARNSGTYPIGLRQEVEPAGSEFIGRAFVPARWLARIAGLALVPLIGDIRPIDKRREGSAKEGVLQEIVGGLGRLKRGEIAHAVEPDVGLRTGDLGRRASADVAHDTVEGVKRLRRGQEGGRGRAVHRGAVAGPVPLIGVMDGLRFGRIEEDT